MEPVPLQSYERAAELIRNADGLVVAAGAGMGVDSGLPDFRGESGFWRAYPALAKARIEFRSIASPEALARDPQLFWGFYGHRLNLYRTTQPHAGYALIREWGNRLAHGVGAVTSNVDGHFQSSDYERSRIREIHGSINFLQCSLPCNETVWPATDFEPIVHESACRLLSPLPHCPACGAVARPNVLMFNDWGFVEDRAAHQEAQFSAWLERLQRPVVLEIGAGSAIPSIRMFAQRMRHGGRASVIRINPDSDKQAVPVDVHLTSSASGALRAISEVLKGDMANPE